jgi:hypothetical protein
MSSRVPIPDAIAAKVLFDADHTCCICRDRGKPVQIHHVDEDPSNNDEENLSVLCLICHDQTQITGGFGRKLDAKLVLQYRRDWLERVRQRRDKADEIAALRMAGSESAAGVGDEDVVVMIAADQALTTYVESLPDALLQGYDLARPRWNTGVTAEMVEGTYNVIDVVVQMLVHLASWFPERHFDEMPPDQYFSRFVSVRFLWHRALAEPDGIGTGGTIVGPTAAAGVLGDVEGMVNEMVSALLWGREGFSLNAWRGRWMEAQR